MLVVDLSYRIGMNIASRAIRSMMRAKRMPGAFSIGAERSFYEIEGMRFLYDYSKFGVAGNIDSGGTTEEATRAKLHELLTSINVFYDVGAHEGLFSISVKKRASEVRVLAFEPQPQALLENLMLNGIRDVKVYQTALGQSPGSVQMTTDKRSSNHVMASGSPTSNAVPVTTIDLIVANGADPPDAIKMDIEGYELHALRGAQQTLRRYQPLVVTEINHCFFRYHKGLSGLFDYMNGLGYEFRCLNNGKLIQSKAADQLTSLSLSDDSNYWWVPTRWATITQ
jgi:FkbM family methyltransferase